jgi:hypothetical protein
LGFIRQHPQHAAFLARIFTRDHNHLVVALDLDLELRLLVYAYWHLDIPFLGNLSEPESA